MLKKAVKINHVTVTKGIILSIISLSFSFGFIKLITGIDFERLHIFLFNLTCGGTIILYYTEGKKIPSLKTILFFIGSIVYSLLAFFEMYISSISISLTLALIIEIVRIKRFAFLPVDFFKKNVYVSEKFHQASLICLSLALFLSTAVILNNEYYHWFYFEKLTLNVFFLGYSFPVSLITLSVMFTFINKRDVRWIQLVENLIFWIINCGVVIFFIFIIFELFIPEAFISTVLAVAVTIMFIFFIKYGIDNQQKYFLISGMIFLLFTAITGVLYIILKVFPEVYKGYGSFILQMHSYLSLYGWNMSGIMVIIRLNDFPLKINSIAIILFHWLTIAILAPIGRHYTEFSFAAIAAFSLLLFIFFSGSEKESVPNSIE